jgi:anti-anti-sigma factor
MAESISSNAKSAFESCELAKSLTGALPEPGTQCWLFVQDDAGRLNKKCGKCPYYLEFQEAETVRVEYAEGEAVVFLKGLFTEKRVSELKAVLEGVMAKAVNTVCLDCSSLGQLPHTGLGVMLQCFKALKAKNRHFFIINPQAPFKAELESTKLIKIFPMAATVEAARQVVRKHEAEMRKREEERRAKEAREREEARAKEARAREEKKKQRMEEAKTMRCWIFFKGQNPKNATPCSACHYKASGSDRHCWMVVGEIDGVTFEYIEEECMSCAYYIKFNPKSHVEAL